ncbi:MAG: hypothetical protein JWL81_2170 [Verrucomicrobiales bacterium]|nr:hypothetical protein [Verrucomicrobiales bacterium]
MVKAATTPAPGAPPVRTAPPLKKTASAQSGSRNRSLVHYWIFGLEGRKDSALFTPAALLKKIKAGLPVQEVEELRENLDLPMDRLSPLLGISKATWHRRQSTGRLDTAESDRVARFARLLGRATVVMESLVHARRWLNSPQTGLGGEVPLAYADTEVGAREVEDLLGRIEYGVYS